MKHIWLVIPIALVGYSQVGCSHKEEAPPKPVVMVKLAKVEVVDIPLTVQAAATVFPREQASITARTTSPIRELRAHKGDSVTKGQVLAVLENRDTVAQRAEAAATVVDAQATLQKTTSGTLPTDVERGRGELSKAESALNQAQKNYDRRNELFKQGAIPNRDLLASETDLAQARTGFEVAKKTLDLLQNQSQGKDITIAASRVDQAKARMALADAQLQYTELRSPIAGTVTEQFQYPGDMAKPDTPVFTLMDLSIVVARGQVPETDVGGLKTGQACGFASADAPAAAAAGRITVIGKSVDPARRTVEVWCEIPNSVARLRAGAFGTLTVSTGTAAHSVVAPQSAVQFNEGTRNGTVMVVDDKHIAHKREIEGGEVVERKVQIVKGLKAGEVVIAEGGYGLPDGTEVKTAEETK